MYALAAPALAALSLSIYKKGYTMEKKSQVGKTALTIGLCFLFMFALNLLMPLHRDDYEYSLIWETNRHIQNLPDIFESLYRHYFMHGGRMVSFFTQEVFLLHDKVYFDVANALVYTGLLLLLLWHSMRRVTLDIGPWRVALAFLLMWLAFPHFGEVAVWMCGSVVYLWTGFWGFLFLLPYNLFFAGRFEKSGPLTAFVMLIVGVLAGWSVENLSVTVNAIAFLTAVYCWRNKKLRAWMVTGLLGSTVGFFLLVGAPGNYVRYGQQGAGKGILRHIGNQFAGGGEMMLYVLPVLLLLILAWKGIRLMMLRQRGEEISCTQRSFGAGQIVTLAVIAVMLASYTSGGWLNAAISDFLIAHVLVPLHMDKPMAVYRLAHTLSGLEEMVIYLAGVAIIYSLAKKAMGIPKGVLKSVKLREIWAAFREARFATVCFGLAAFNNFVMIAAPTFPARATFSSVCLILIGTLAILAIPEVGEAFRGRVLRILTIGGAAVGLFLAFGAFLISYTMTVEQAKRIAILEEKQGSMEIVEFPPLPINHRAMRHVFFVDFDNVVTKGGIVRYYGVEDIEVK